MEYDEIKKKRNLYLGIAFAVFILALVLMFFKFSNKLSFFSDYTSKNIYVYNLTKEKMVLSKKANEKVSPASLTKIMTARLALDKIEDLSQLAPIDVDSYRKMVQKNSSMAGFYGKEATTYRDLLYGTILASGGECAKTLAIRAMGTEEDFVKAMNQKVEDLGLKNTHFSNPEGMDEESHYSTAEDIGKMLADALKDGDFRAIFTKEVFLSSKTLDHPEGNRVISTVLSKVPHEEEDFKILGGKSGTTTKAGHCWATLAEKNNMEYIVVVMGAPFEEGQEGHIEDTIKILRDL